MQKETYVNRNEEEWAWSFYEEKKQKSTLVYYMFSLSLCLSGVVGYFIYF